MSSVALGLSATCAVDNRTAYRSRAKRVDCRALPRRDSYSWASLSIENAGVTMRVYEPELQKVGLTVGAANPIWSSAPCCQLQGKTALLGKEGGGGLGSHLWAGPFGEPQQA